jgi:MFS family permease
VAIPHKWTALCLATLGVVMVTINQSILLISLPDIFRGIDLNPLAPANVSYFLWVLMGFLLVTAVLVVSLGRVGDLYGRARMFNLGFAVFTFFSILLSVTFLTGVPGVLWIIVLRVFQGVGGALLFANSNAIITDAFPASERGRAMGINGVGAVSGSFLGLILGGVLAPVEWRLVFVVSVPFGLLGTVWGYRRLRDTGVRVVARSTGSATRRLPSGSSPYSRGWCTRCSRTAGTRRVGRTPGSSVGCSVGSPCSACSSGSRPRCLLRCSTSSCSGSGPSSWATSPG